MVKTISRGGTHSLTHTQGVMKVKNKNVLAGDQILNRGDISFDISNTPLMDAEMHLKPKH